MIRLILVYRNLMRTKPGCQLRPFLSNSDRPALCIAFNNEFDCDIDELHRGKFTLFIFFNNRARYWWMRYGIWFAFTKPLTGAKHAAV